MKVSFICLANSKKYGERCIAGIEVQRGSAHGYNIVKTENQPTWIRPVSRAEHGEIAANLVQDIELADVVEIEVIRPCPQGYQSENVLFLQRSIRVVQRLKLQAGQLDKLANQSEEGLFGNHSRYVAADKIGAVGHSLVLIQVNQASIFMMRGLFHSEKIRAKFVYQGTEYELPVTDVGFIARYKTNPVVLEQANAVYFTISLGICYEGWYYKLVAGIVTV